MGSAAGTELNGDEVGVAVKQRGKLIFVPECLLFRLRGKKLPRVATFSCLQLLRRRFPLFVVVPRFVSALGPEGSSSTWRSGGKFVFGAGHRLAAGQGCSLRSAASEGIPAGPVRRTAVDSAVML
jgi:hypothetical protein